MNAAGTPRLAAVFGWRSASAAAADGVMPTWLERQDLLESHVVLPAVGEVVLVDKALTGAEAKVGQPYVSGIVTVVDSGVTPDAVLTAVADKAGPSAARSA
jgi:hypothetical protein